MRQRELVQTTDLLNSDEKVGERVKRSFGRIALRVTAIAAGVGALLTGVTAVEAVAGREAHAEASPFSANGAEKAWCRWPSRYKLCSKASELGSKAFSAAEIVAVEQQWALEDGGADAVRHCYWNALMTKEMGRDTASGFAWRHEYTEKFGSEASNMDLHNNLKGRDWAGVADPLQRCIEGVNKGQLIRLVQ